MSKKTYQTGKLSYPVVRPNVRALEGFKGKRLDTKGLLELLEHVGFFARSLNPRVNVLWQDNIPTDHSITNADGSWTIKANPLRLTRTSRIDPGNGDNQATMTMDGVASTVGALLHEVAHTKLSPDTRKTLAKVTPSERAILGVYEDLYVNTQLSAELPGLKNLLPHCYNWTNPRDTLVPLVENPTGQAGWFSDAVAALGADFMAYVNGKKFVDFPHEWQAELADRLRPIRDRIASGRPLTWSQRLTLYRRAVKITYGVLHKHGLYDPPEGQQGGQPQSGEAGEGGESGSGAGAQSDASQQPQPGGSGGEGQGDENLDQLGDSDGLKDVTPKEEATEGTGCSSGDHEGDESAQKQRANVTARGASGITKAAQAANAISEAKQHGGSNDPADYGEVDGCFISPATQNYSTDHYDKERANRLRRVFRTFSSTRRGWEHGTDAGRLSARRLPGLVAGTKRNVFKARTEIRGTQGAVLILIDGSGSMGGKPYEQAALAARELFESIGHNPDYKVYAWAYSGGGAQVDVISARYSQGQLYWPPCDGGSTPSWAAMVNAAKFLKRKHPNKKRVIVHLTDLGWNDSYIPGFTTDVMNDPDLDYVTIGIDNGYGSSARGDDHVKMRVSRFSANGDIVGAVQEFAKKAFRG